MNSGAPYGRRRTEPLRASVLGADDGAIRCPRVLRLGLDFGGADPLAAAQAALAACGYRDETEACAALALPRGRYLCRPDPAPRPTALATLAPAEALRHLLMLGLCTPWLYDPARPVTWTRASLRRCLELFEAGGFYA